MPTTTKMYMYLCAFSHGYYCSAQGESFELMSVRILHAKPPL